MWVLLMVAWLTAAVVEPAQAVTSGDAVFQAVAASTRLVTSDIAEGKLWSEATAKLAAACALASKDATGANFQRLNEAEKEVDKVVESAVRGNTQLLLEIESSMQMLEKDPVQDCTYTYIRSSIGAAKYKKGQIAP
ncbi:hypothetical protein GMLC_40250 [Geomonas limicola]|uniref:DUF4398 domain-containing protein n=1 Tax=Geomonas limicola TaxID=2740186 RepID=A0A6V8ND31_9BACT|nr:hypothetical protein [Geomonas limicola]GFO70446.1 hypothetical protein GMLC_40250 [Geomonas limicola]